MKESGKRDMLVEKEHFTMLMETNTQDLGKTTSAMVTEFTKTKKVQDTKAIGKMTHRAVRVKRHGQKDHNTLAPIKMVKRKDLASTHGQTVPCTKATGSTTR